MTTHKYWILGKPYTPGDGVRRDTILEKDGDGNRTVSVPVPTECIGDVLELIRHAYDQGRKDAVKDEVMTEPDLFHPTNVWKVVKDELVIETKYLMEYQQAIEGNPGAKAFRMFETEPQFEWREIP